MEKYKLLMEMNKKEYLEKKYQIQKGGSYIKLEKRLCSRIKNSFTE